LLLAGAPHANEKIVDPICIKLSDMIKQSRPGWLLSAQSDARLAPSRNTAVAAIRGMRLCHYDLV
jgi:hypothetical protein